MVVSGSMMLPVSQAPSICTGGSSSSHHKKFENSLSTEEEDLVPAMEDEVDGEEDKFPSFCRLLRSGAICTFVILCPGADPQRPTCFAVRVWSTILRTTARAGLTRRDPLEDEPATGRDGTDQPV
ncbi:hypothetical protein F2Q69_00054440 [Brassica cretica]|uniref:Uncharacterized protein n=1 Tax=Brassica cretica TaxID=69181 RepID=A0A8S9N5Q0_BRACR|nr:hypothetical protein F2Q69_00054440 [Brassica cretica]